MCEPEAHNLKEFWPYRIVNLLLFFLFFAGSVVMCVGHV
jgi:hypothetical protein